MREYNVSYTVTGLQNHPDGICWWDIITAEDTVDAINQVIANERKQGARVTEIVSVTER